MRSVGIQKFIGRRPIIAFGNSDGDQQMLQWTAAGKWVVVDMKESWKVIYLFQR